MGPDNIPIRHTTPSQEASRESSQDVRNRPPPNERKDFQRILEKKESKSNHSDQQKNVKKKRSDDSAQNVAKDDDEEEEDVDSPINTLYKPKRPTLKSLADQDREDLQSLASAMSGQKAKRPGGDPTASPFSLYKQMASEHTGKATDWEALAQAGSDLPVAPQEKTLRKERSGKFDEEQMNPAQMNPATAPFAGIATVSDRPTELTGSRATALKEIVDKILAQLQVLETSGKTETVVTIKNNPLFEGAKFIITEFKSATKEFNLAFENLRPDAKIILDDNINALRNSLLQDGYARAIHIVTTTTNIEHRIMGESATPFAGRDRENQQQDQQRKKRQQEDTESQA